MVEGADAATKSGVLKVSVTFMDSSVIRAHRHAAGARKKGAAKL